MSEEMVTLKNYRQKLGERAYLLLGEISSLETHEQAIAWEHMAQLLAVEYRLYEMLERKGGGSETD